MVNHPVPRVRVGGTILFQSLTWPHDLATPEISSVSVTATGQTTPFESGNGSHVRAKVLSSRETLSIMEASETARVIKVRPVGSPAATPNLAALMRLDAAWEVEQMLGAEWVPATAIRIDPNALGWDVYLQVNAQ